MSVWDGICLAGEQLLRRRLRAFLCALSVGIGVAAMLLIGAMGTYGQRQVQTALDRIGLSGLVVYLSGGTAGRELTAASAQEIAACFAGQVRYAMPLKANTAAYRLDRRSGNAVLLGTDGQLGEVMHLRMVAGRLFSAAQAKDGDHVAVVDTALARELLGRENIVGTSLYLTVHGEETAYRIIGVIEPQTAALGAAVQTIAPTLIYVPYACLAAETDAADQIFVNYDAGTDVSRLIGQIRRFLYGTGQVEGTLKVQDMGSAAASARQAEDVVTLVFAAVAAVSFAVALLGLVNGLLASAYEKTPEIGMFMAIGARRRDIALLFLCQSTLICLGGGLGGVLLAALLLRAASWRLGLTASLPPLLALGMLAASLLFGLLAGVAPAMMAARLRPVDAMRK